VFFVRLGFFVSYFFCIIVDEGKYIMLLLLFVEIFNTYVLQATHRIAGTTHGAHNQRNVFVVSRIFLIPVFCPET
jgi:hypothetical protein